MKEMGRPETSDKLRIIPVVLAGVLHQRPALQQRLAAQHQAVGRLPGRRFGQVADQDTAAALAPKMSASGAACWRPAPARRRPAPAAAPRSVSTSLILRRRTSEQGD